MSVDLAIIVLNYRTADLTAACLESLENNIEPGVLVVVVDNSSGDASADQVEATIHARGWSGWARVLRSEVNGGFAAGNNLGMRSVDAAAYILLNSDTIVRPGALHQLREAMRRHPDAGIIGSGLRTATGEQAYSCFRFITPVSEFLRGANTGAIARALRRFDPIMPLSQYPRAPAWVSFACALIRREVLQAIGFLDDGYFMYFEDVDYCHRAHRAGWNVLYWPDAQVVHLAGGTSQITDGEGEGRRAPKYYYAARARYFAKHYGVGGLWLANSFWYAGRLVSLSRELFGRPSSQRDHEGLDIWTNALHPLRSGSGQAP